MTDFDSARDLRILSESSIDLVGRQRVEAEGDLFLADHGVNWLTGKFDARPANR